ncbi:hypothetical protein [Streptomyces sp. NPDC056796]
MPWRLSVVANGTGGGKQLLGAERAVRGLGRVRRGRRRTPAL